MANDKRNANRRTTLIVCDTVALAALRMLRRRLTALVEVTEIANPMALATVKESVRVADRLLLMLLETTAELVFVTEMRRLNATP
jgi:hypothetical protein